MPKDKTHKGLQKRIKITGGSKVVHKASGKSHLNSVMTGGATRRKRNVKVCDKTIAKKLERVLHTHLKGAD